MQWKVEHQATGMVIGTVSQIVASHLVSAGAALGVAALVWQTDPRHIAAVAIALLVACVVGLVFHGTLLNGLYLAALALQRLANGLSLQPIPLRLRWPLRDMLADINAVGLQLKERDDREQRAIAHRDQLLRHVGDAAAQEERNRLARDLHDSIKQQIFSISMSAAAAQARWESDAAGARTALGEIQRGAQEAQIEMQALLQQLRPAPLENTGLIEALRVQAQALGFRTGAEVTVRLGDLPSDEQIPPGAQDALFRIAQEALSNVARHARAHAVTLTLEARAGALVMEIHDDGQGFVVAQPRGGMGLASVRERAQALGGTLDLRSAPGAGTTLVVRVPLMRPVQAPTRPAPRDDQLSGLLREGHQAVKSGVSFAGIGALLIFFSAPVGLAALSAVAAIVQAIRAYGYHARVAMRAGDGSAQAQYLAARVHGLLSGGIGLLALCAWYLPLLRDRWTAHVQWWGAFALSAALGVVALVAMLRWYGLLDRAFAGCSTEEQGSRIKERMQAVHASAGTWLAGVILTFVFGGLQIGMPLHTAAQWADDASLALLISWPIMDLLEYRQARRWIRGISTRKERL